MLDKIICVAVSGFSGYVFLEPFARLASAFTVEKDIQNACSNIGAVVISLLTLIAISQVMKLKD